MCSDAPVTPPVGAFELEVEESHWDNVYRAIEYLKQAEREKTMTQPEDAINRACLLYTSPSPRDATLSRMPSSA